MIDDDGIGVPESAQIKERGYKNQCRNQNNNNQAQKSHILKWQWR
jgi:hypothetical protein